MELFADAGDADVEIGTKSPDMAKRHLVPCRGRFGFQRKRMKSCGANAENTFCDNAGKESAFSREMALVAFGPGFDGIRNVLTKQAGIGVEMKKIDGFVRISCCKNAAEGIERGAVPEGIAAGLCEEPVFSP